MSAGKERKIRSTQREVRWGKTRKANTIAAKENQESKGESRTTPKQDLITTEHCRGYSCSGLGVSGSLLAPPSRQLLSLRIFQNPRSRCIRWASVDSSPQGNLDLLIHGYRELRLSQLLDTYLEAQENVSTEETDADIVPSQLDSQIRIEVLMEKLHDKLRWHCNLPTAIGSGSRPFLGRSCRHTLWHLFTPNLFFFRGWATFCRDIPCHAFGTAAVLLPSESWIHLWTLAPEWPWHSLACFACFFHKTGRHQKLLAASVASRHCTHPSHSQTRRAHTCKADCDLETGAEQQPRSASRHCYTSRDLSGVVVVSLTVDGLEVTFSMRGFGRNSNSF